MNRFVNTVLAVAGTLCVVMGIIGIFLPLIPTTPFLLLGAACYLKGSQKLYDKLINNKLLGTYIKDYREGRGIPQKSKAYAITLLWISMGYSIVFLVDTTLIRIILVLIAVGVTWHILSLKNAAKAVVEEDKEIEDDRVINS